MRLVRLKQTRDDRRSMDASPGRRRIVRDSIIGVHVVEGVLPTPGGVQSILLIVSAPAQLRAR
jgi:hypothetical protein